MKPDLTMSTLREAGGQPAPWPITAAPTTTTTTTTAPAPTRLGGHWPELLWDLGCVGELWVETQSSALTLAHRTALTAMRVQAGIGHVQGADFALRILLDRCESVRGGSADGSAAPTELAIEDARRHPMLTLRALPEADISRRLLGCVLGAHGGRDRRIVPAAARSAEPRLRDASAHPAAQLARRCDGLGDGIDLHDMAELCGLTAFDPFRLREHGRAIGVDPTLVPHALEAVADHLLPIRLVTGNDAVVRRLHCMPYLARTGPGSLYLRADGVTLRLNTLAIDSAFVFQPDSGLPRRELRLYDADGRAIACFGAGADNGADKGAGHGAGQPVGDPPAWRALLDALED